MYPDFDTPERHLSREPFPEPDSRCSDCAGTGLLTDPKEPCIYCDGTGEAYVAPEWLRREQLRALEAALRQIDSTGRRDAAAVSLHAPSRVESHLTAAGRGTAPVGGPASEKVA